MKQSISLLCALLCAGVVFAAPFLEPGMETEYGFNIWMQSTRPNSYPTGIAAGQDGYIYVHQITPGGYLSKHLPGPGTALDSDGFIQFTGANDIVGMAFDGSGRLWACYRGIGMIIRLDPNTGAPVAGYNQWQAARSDTTTPMSLLDIKRDPLSGDMFFTYGGRGIIRMSDLDNNPPTFTAYGGLAPAGAVYDGLYFAPDNSLYVADLARNKVVRYLPTNTPGLIGDPEDVATIQGLDGIGIDGTGQYLYAAVTGVDENNQGGIVRMDLQDPAHPVEWIVRNAGRGDLATVGADGCFYSSHKPYENYSSSIGYIIRLSKADGTCLGLYPSSPEPEPGPCAACQNTIRNKICLQIGC